MKIAVLGTGAMGSVYAGMIADSGHEVWAIDTWQEPSFGPQCQLMAV